MRCFGEAPCAQLKRPCIDASRSRSTLTERVFLDSFSYSGIVIGHDCTITSSSAGTEAPEVPKAEGPQLKYPQHRGTQLQSTQLGSLSLEERRAGAFYGRRVSRNGHPANR